MSDVYVSSPIRLRQLNVAVAAGIEAAGHDVFLPHELDDGDVESDPRRIRRECVEAIDAADAVVVTLDDYGMDSAWEVGYAEGTGVDVLGLSIDRSTLSVERTLSAQSVRDHWMHDWNNTTVVEGVDGLADAVDADSVYLSVPPADEELADALTGNLDASVTTTADVAGGADPPADPRAARQHCASAIAAADVFVASLDDYRMNAAWELGYAEAAGARILGVVRRPGALDELSSPPPRSVEDRWLHGWTTHPVVESVDALTAALEGDPPEQHRTPVVCPIVEQTEGDEHRVLVQTRAKASDPTFSGLVEVPGGRINVGETVAEAARREVREEAGIEVEPVGMAGGEPYEARDAESWTVEPFAVVEEVGGHDYLGVFVRCHVVGGSLRDTEEATDHRWVTPDELEKLFTEGEVLPVNAPGLRRYVEWIRGRSVVGPGSVVEPGEK